MIKEKIINICVQLFRSCLVRIANDIEINQKVVACTSSAEFVLSKMGLARAVSSREELMQCALGSRRLNGFICELGVYRGASLNYIADAVPGLTVYGFDSFDGLPQNWRNDYLAGEFKVEFEEIKFRKNCRLYKGMFSDTLPVFLNEVSEDASLVHIDCDLYSSTADALSLLSGRIKKGTVIIFDEYFNYPLWEQHEHKAFQEFIYVNKINVEYICYNKRGEQIAVRVI